MSAARLQSGPRAQVTGKGQDGEPLHWAYDVGPQGLEQREGGSAESM